MLVIIQFSLVQCKVDINCQKQILKLPLEKKHILRLTQFIYISPYRFAGQTFLLSTRTYKPEKYQLNDPMYLSYFMEFKKKKENGIVQVGIFMGTLDSAFYHVIFKGEIHDTFISFAYLLWTNCYTVPAF